jgi:quinol monooxygenase YgiN
MRFVNRALLGMLLTIGSIQMASAQATTSPNPSAMIYVVSYLDVVARQKAQGITMLKQFRTACAGESGNLRCEAVQRMEQQNEFAILEVWKDEQAYQAHAAGPGAQLRARLKPILASPYDERVHTGFAVLAPQPAPAGRIVYAITHVDIMPSKAGEAGPVFSQMAEAGRKEAGNGRLEVLQQLAPRTNHYTLVEIWSNKRTLENHQALPATIQYRENLQPMMGALYDERLYKILD